MKVKELIAKLEKCKGEEEVYIEDFIEGCAITRLEVVKRTDKYLILSDNEWDVKEGYSHKI